MWNLFYSSLIVFSQEFQDIWPSLKVIIDQGRICDPVTPNSRSGSTVVNVSKKGYFNIIRTGRFVVLCLIYGG